ncbi:MAG: 4-phospho-D-threonate 3-dehydrogenase, partial [Deltaproteobacteria bacterium]|nr:4-phospho-D-threonate 3-dehydrogenase [Deltaproteobacteria bacterium]
MDKRPIIGITMGDPSGIGPEIINKLFLDDSLLSICNPIIFGDTNVLSEYADRSLMIREITSPDAAEWIQGTMNVLIISALDKKDY